MGEGTGRGRSRDWSRGGGLVVEAGSHHDLKSSALALAARAWRESAGAVTRRTRAWQELDPVGARLRDWCLRLPAPLP